MSYFLSPQNLSVGQEVEIGGEEAAHILLARRVKKGEKIKLQGPNGKRYLTEVVGVRNRDLEVKVLEEIEAPEELSIEIVLYQSFVSEKALDFIFQKSTELGAMKIVLFNSTNTATKITKDQFNKKLARWQKIFWESAKQCDCRIVPELEYHKDLNEIIASAIKLDHLFVLDAAANEFLKDVILNFRSKPSNVGLVVGPEGGLTLEEIDALHPLPNFHLTKLGPLILRAETAALSSVAITQALLN